jgi:hypothetical protein
MSRDLWSLLQKVGNLVPKFWSVSSKPWKCLTASLENLNEFPNLHFIGNIKIPILKLIQNQILVEKPQRYDIGNLFSEKIKTDTFQN